MRKIYSIFIVAACIALYACSKKEQDPGKDMGALHISKTKPMPGDELLLTYSPKDSVKEITAYYMYFTPKQSYAEDVIFKDSLGEWTSSIKIPDSATFIAVSIKTDDNLDNNEDKGYSFPLYNSEGKTVPAALINESLFYQRYATHPSFKVQLEKDSALALMQTDFKNYPDLTNDYDVSYASYLSRMNKDEGTKFIDERITFYTSKDTITEANYKSLASLYSISDDRVKYDSINKLIIDKYPMSSAAQISYLQNFSKAKTLEEKEKIATSYWDTFGDKATPYYSNYLAQNLASMYSAKNDTEKVKAYLDKMDSPSSKASFLNSLAWNMAEKGENLDQAAAMSKQSLTLLKTAINGEKPKDAFYLTPSQYKKSLETSYSMDADTYAYILFQQGHKEEALKYQEEAIANREDPEVIERYIQYLVANNNYQKAEKEASKYIADGVATNAVKENYKTVYTKNHDNVSGFNDILTNLEARAHQKLLANLKKEMINKPAPNFTLKDIDGKEVALNSLKGKTVVLDFWATWCGPCKASFPGMKMAVNKYKDSDKVVFLFIDTLEDGKTRHDDVAKFIADNDYPFHVVMDQPKEEGSRAFKTTDAYGITGIPTKIIIGPDGQWKFSKVGFNGNNDEMLNEIDLMIELSQS
ncbi:redoxin domain-containing protein [Zhouia sp. PK063]|uniref:redoxin domain-containing protein n=1 Tax=Zhouia sp. PK063 TaxID=3373602 RepID=UPI003796334F